MGKKKPSGIHMSRRGMLVWIGLIVFIAGWMFVLGIMVGRGMAPVNLEVGKLEKELEDLRAKMMNREQAKVEAQISGKDENLPELGYPEALTSPKKEESFKSLPKKPAAKAMKVPKPKKPAAKPKPAPKPKPKPKPKAAPVVKPVAPPTPKSAPQPKPASPAVAQKGRFSIQVAAVQNAQSAEQLAAKLRKKGYRAYRIRSEVPGKGVWYRIRVGAFEDRVAADKVLAKLKADKFGGMVISTQ